MKITINTLQAGILSLCLAAITSCSKDAQTPGSPSSPGLAKKIQKKWIIGGNKSVQADTNITSLEFNNSNQAIVIQNTAGNPNIISSHYYSIKDEKTVEIKNFGTLIVDSITDNTGKFRFTPATSSTPKELRANAFVSSIGSNSNTDRLCRTWKLNVTQFELYQRNPSTGNYDLVGTESEPGLPDQIITITSAGTYYFPASGDSTIEYWKWSANGSNSICTGFTPTINCDDRGTVDVSFEGPNINFIMTEFSPNGDYKEVEINKCSPYTFTGGRIAVPSANPIERKGFFSRKR